MFRKIFKFTKLSQKKSAHSVDAFLKYLPSSHFKQKPKSRYQKFLASIKNLLNKIHKRGMKRITIMLIPHTEKNILSWHLSLYMIIPSVFFISFILVLSIIGLVNKTGEDIQYYDMGLSDKQFGIQAINIAEAILPFHNLINSYIDVIAELYLKLDGDKKQVQGILSSNEKLMKEELDKFKEMIEKCKEATATCDTAKVEDILRNTIYLSFQDNYKMKKSIELSESILETLNTKEKKNLFKNTPTISPTNGFLIAPYGYYTDPMYGRKVFKRGIQIGAIPGTEVLSTAPGEISDISFDEEYGLKIFITHSYGFATFYAHLDRVKVQKGEKIAKGEVIGYVGQTGKVSQPMLYYEVHVGTVAYNPFAFINHLENPWLLPPKI